MIHYRIRFTWFQEILLVILEVKHRFITLHLVSPAHIKLKLVLYILILCLERLLEPLLKKHLYYKVMESIFFQVILLACRKIMFISMNLIPVLLIHLFQCHIFNQKVAQLILWVRKLFMPQQDYLCHFLLKLL